MLLITKLVVLKFNVIFYINFLKLSKFLSNSKQNKVYLKYTK